MNPAMRYSLPAIAIDEEELESIQTRILPSIVQKLGMSSKLPTAVRHGPTTMGGLGLMDIRTECGIEMIKYFWHQVYRKSEVGELLLIQLKALQVEAGIQQPLLEFPSLEIPYLTPTWVLSMRQFLSNHNLTITVTDELRIPLRGDHDDFIMSAERLSRYTAGQQRDINLVRMYLQCSTLSDLCDTHQPKEIARSLLAGDRSPSFVSRQGWPRQGRPSAAQCRLWRKYLSSHFLRYGTLWKRTPIHTLRELKHRQDQEPSPVRTGAREFQTIIDELPRHQQRLLSHVNFVSSADDVWKASREKRSLTIATDGGLKDIRGTFGWTISTVTNTTLCEGSGPVDGPRDVANSTRCEIAGLAAPLLFLNLLIRQWGTRFRGKFRWVCDSKSAISNVSKHTDITPTSRSQPANVDQFSNTRVQK